MRAIRSGGSIVLPQSPVVIVAMWMRAPDLAR
jgi:hypothetical protein